MFLHEWQMIRRSTLIWACSMIGVMALYLSIFPSLSQDAEQFRELFATYPESFREAIGVSLDSIASLIGFYSFVFGFVVLVAAIQAMNLGLGMLSREVRDKTADFLLTKPVTRTQIITAKLTAGVLSLLVSNAVYVAAASLMAFSVREASFQWHVFFMISITALFVQLIFMSLGMVVSVFAAKIKSVISISLGTVFGFYAIGMLGSVIGDKAIRYITPFKYFDTAYIIAHSAYEVSFVILSIVIIIATVCTSYYVYAKKDIHAV
ncbi:ABC transporter permease subunit [Paenibacillus sp. FA6]|uniref:ABC transporter permease subunit n=1 Tax=Paenibacillus sp. FA6 TaxID=3413029 RepID=UPI003F6584F8